MRTPSIDFVGRAPKLAIVSATILAVSIVSVLIRGLDLSIDFVGGTSFVLTEVSEEVTAEDLRTAAESQGATDVIAQLQLTDGRPSGATVRMEAIEPASDQAGAVRQALLEVSGASDVVASFVGPTWGERITRQAVEALIVFLIVIVIYISLRLDVKMAIAAVVALVHDVALTMGIYALVGFNVSPATVIALLTILGYSLYDTVVVFDRVNENSITLGDPGRRTYIELVNSSLNEVLYRSINTSITSILPVGALLFIGARVLGATTLQDLALALFIGMAVGIYSSLFIAGPLLAWMKMREPAEQRRAAKVARSEAGGAQSQPEIDAAAPVAGSPESRAPITTDYVRGTGKSGKRKRRR